MTSKPNPPVDFDSSTCLATPSGIRLPHTPNAAIDASTPAPDPSVAASPEGSGGTATNDCLTKAPLVQAGTGYDGSERRSSPRIPKSLEISVQPLAHNLIESGLPFFAITRDISTGGLAYLSSRQAGCEKALISLNDGVAPGIVCRICNESLLHCTGPEKVWLTNVQFLHVDRRA